MKKLKVSLSMFALILGLGTAFATAHHAKPASKTWSRNPSTGLYSDITGQPQTYNCDDAQTVCTAVYPSDVDPNNQAGDAHPGIAQPTSVELGNFSN
jgi:hypothetical protein